MVLFFSEYPSVKLVIHHAKGNDPSKRAQNYRHSSKVVSHRDAGNDCFRISLLKALELFALRSTAA